MKLKLSKKLLYWILIGCSALYLILNSIDSHALWYSGFLASLGGWAFSLNYPVYSLAGVYFGGVAIAATYFMIEKNRLMSIVLSAVNAGNALIAFVFVLIGLFGQQEAWAVPMIIGSLFWMGAAALQLVYVLMKKFGGVFMLVNAGLAALSLLLMILFTLFESRYGRPVRWVGFRYWQRGFGWLFDGISYLMQGKGPASVVFPMSRIIMLLTMAVGYLADDNLFGFLKRTPAPRPTVTPRPVQPGMPAKGPGVTVFAPDSVMPQAAEPVRPAPRPQSSLNPYAGRPASDRIAKPDPLEPAAIVFEPVETVGPETAEPESMTDSEPAYAPADEPIAEPEYAPEDESADELPANVPVEEPAPACPGHAAEPAPAEPSPAVAGKIRQLAELRDLGVLTEEEFQNKKADLLSNM